MARPLRNSDWDLRSCGLLGHATYWPDETSLADRLRLETQQGHRVALFALRDVRGR